MFHLSVRQKIFLSVFFLLVLSVVFLPNLSFALDISEALGNIFKFLLGAFLKGLTYFLGLFQALFLKVVEFTILDFAKGWGNDGILSGFRVAWQILRDLVNLIIVIIFVINAAMVAFGDGKFGFYRKSLLYLIGAAIFVNFSAFFTLFILDISHLLFILFFNVIDATSWGSLSPFSGFDSVLNDIGSPMLLFVVNIIAIVVTWFLILGILYFSIILIERYVIAMFLVLLSPIAMLGFFTSISGGSNALTARLSGAYNQWKERLGYVFTAPVILIFGFTILLVLFRDALGAATNPGNYVEMLGIGSEAGRTLLFTLIIASIVLVLGMFHLGNLVKNANIHQSVAGKFRFGEFMQKRAHALWKSPKTIHDNLNRRNLGRQPLTGRMIDNARGFIGNKVKENPRSRILQGLNAIPGVTKPLGLRDAVRKSDVGGRLKRGVAVVQEVDQALLGNTEERERLNAKRKNDREVSGIINGGTVGERMELVEKASSGEGNITLTSEHLSRLSKRSDTTPEIQEAIARSQNAPPELLDTLQRGARRQNRRLAKEHTDLQASADQKREEEMERIGAVTGDDDPGYKALQKAQKRVKKAENMVTDVKDGKISANVVVTVDSSLNTAQASLDKVEEKIAKKKRSGEDATGLEEERGKLESDIKEMRTVREVAEKYEGESIDERNRDAVQPVQTFLTQHFESESSKFVLQKQELKQELIGANKAPEDFAGRMEQISATLENISEKIKENEQLQNANTGVIAASAANNTATRNTVESVHSFASDDRDLQDARLTSRQLKDMADMEPEDIEGAIRENERFSSNTEGSVRDALEQVADMIQNRSGGPPQNAIADLKEKLGTIEREIQKVTGSEERIVNRNGESIAALLNSIQTDNDRKLIDEGFNSGYGQTKLVEIQSTLEDLQKAQEEEKERRETLEKLQEIRKEIEGIKKIHRIAGTRRINYDNLHGDDNYRKLKLREQQLILKPLHRARTIEQEVSARSLSNQIDIIFLKMQNIKEQYQDKGAGENEYLEDPVYKQLKKRLSDIKKLEKMSTSKTQYTNNLKNG